MIVDNSLVKNNIGVTIEAASIKEVVDKAKSFEQKIIDDEIKKIKNAATSISVSEEESFNKVTRIYFAFMVSRENRHHSRPKKTFLQS